jgi:hypothetical protein
VDPAGATSKGALRFADDPLVDAMVLIHASKGNAAAQDFLNVHRGLISAGRASRYEFLNDASRAELSTLMQEFEVASFEGIDYRAIIAEARQLRLRVEAAPGGRVLGVMDSRQLATAKLSGIDFVTYDVRAYKRALDLGIQAHFLDLEPGVAGPSPAALKAAGYRPVPID